MIAKKYLALICLGLFVAVSFGTSMALMLSRPVAQAPVEKEEAPKEKEEPKKTQEAVRYFYDVGMTEETFRSRYNQVAAEMFSEYPIQLQQVQPYTFQHTITYEDPFTDRLSMMVCRYQDTNLVKGIMISSHAANELDSIQFLSVIASTLTVMEPSFTPKERGEFLKKLGMFSDNGPTDYQHINRSIEHNGKRYFIRGNNGDGVLFGVLGKDILLDPAAAKAAPTDDHNIIIDIVNYAIWLSKQQATAPAQQATTPVASVPQRTNLPRVVGMTANAASAVLQSRGFQVRTEYVYSAYTDEGIVADQSPSSGPNAPIGLLVVLKVAYGKAKPVPQPHPVQQAPYSSPVSTEAPIPGGGTSKGR